MKEQKNMDTLYRAKPYIPSVTHKWILNKFESIPIWILGIDVFIVVAGLLSCFYTICGNPGINEEVFLALQED